MDRPGGNERWSTLRVADSDGAKYPIWYDRFYVTWTWRGVQKDTEEHVSHVLRKDMKPGPSLDAAWQRCRGYVTSFMERFIAFKSNSQLRSYEYKDFQRVANSEIDQTTRYDFGEGQSLSGMYLLSTMKATLLSFLSDHKQRPLDLQVLVDNRRKGVGNASQKLTDADGTLCAVSGHLFIIVDPKTERPIANERVKVLCVSIPGIDFTKHAAKNMLPTSNPLGISELPLAALCRIAQIWHHALYLFQKWGVTHPVLCAIGCGAFIPTGMDKGIVVRHTQRRS